MNQSLNDRQHAGDSGPVIAGSRRVQAEVSVNAIDCWIKWRVCWEDGVEMCREHDHGAAAFGGQVYGRKKTDYIADVIELDIAQSDFSETSGSPVRTSVLSEGRRGYGDQIQLPIHDGLGIVVHPRKRSVDRPPGSKAGDA